MAACWAAVAAVAVAVAVDTDAETVDRPAFWAVLAFAFPCALAFAVLPARASAAAFSDARTASIRARASVLGSAVTCTVTASRRAGALNGWAGRSVRRPTGASGVVVVGAVDMARGSPGWMASAAVALSGWTTTSAATIVPTSPTRAARGSVPRRRVGRLRSRFATPGDGPVGIRDSRRHGCEPSARSDKEQAVHMRPRPPDSESSSPLDAPVNQTKEKWAERMIFGQFGQTRAPTPHVSSIAARRRRSSWRLLTPSLA